jgi:hypothetical protein
VAIDIRARVYTTDRGNDYILGSAQYMDAQNNLGGNPLVGGAAAAEGNALDPLPRGIKPRIVYLHNSAGVKRSVVCFTPDAPLFTGTSTAINLQDGAGVSSAFTVHGSRGESRRGRAAGV